MLDYEIYSCQDITVLSEEITHNYTACFRNIFLLYKSVETIFHQPTVFNISQTCFFK